MTTKKRDQWNKIGKEDDCRKGCLLSKTCAAYAWKYYKRKISGWSKPVKPKTACYTYSTKNLKLSYHKDWTLYFKERCVINSKYRYTYYDLYSYNPTHKALTLRPWESLAIDSDEFWNSWGNTPEDAKCDSNSSFASLICPLHLKCPIELEVTIQEFFVVKPILSDLVILCRLGLQNFKKIYFYSS